MQMFYFYFSIYIIQSFQFLEAQWQHVAGIVDSLYMINR